MGQPVSQTAVERGVQSHAPWRLYADHESLWVALTEDAQRPVLVISSDGHIVFANALFGRMMDEGVTSVIGRALAEILPTALASERLALVRRALQQERPIMIVERIRGKWARTILRRVRDTGAPSGRSDAYVLVVFHLGAPPPSPATLAPGAAPSHGPASVHGSALVATESDESMWSTKYEVVHATSDDPGRLANLSKRELEVLGLIGEGLSTRDIAKRLGRTIKTVEWHRASLGRKLNITNRVELAQIAIAAGMVQPKKAKEARG